MKLDSTFDDFFKSIAFGVVTCTLSVGLGKFLTPYYFYCIITLCLLTIIYCACVHYYKTRQLTWVLKMKEKNNDVATATQRKNENLTLADIVRLRLTLKDYGRKRSSTTVLDEEFDDDINPTNYRRKKRLSYPPDEFDLFRKIVKQNNGTLAFVTSSLLRKNKYSKILKRKGKKMEAKI